MFEIIELMVNNPDNWRNILTGAPYHLSLDEDEDYVLLKYNQIDSDFNQEICRECRGLIINKHVFTPVALSFKKFFNIEEQYADNIDWDSVSVQEKVDGSKILVWYDNIHNEWRISTSGKINASEAEVNSPLLSKPISFKELFEMAVWTNGYTLVEFFSYLNPNKCYTFELVSPYNRVVVPYDITRIYLIGMRDVNTFEEEEPNIPGSNIWKPVHYNLSNLDECRAALENMDWDEEGFVAVDKYWRRVKIKNKKWLQAHYLANNGVQSKSRILEIIENNEQNEFLAYFPEYQKRFAGLTCLLDCFIQQCVEAIEDVKANGPYENRKELALYVMKNYKNISSLIFSYYDENTEEDLDVFAHNWFRNCNSKFKMKVLGLKEDE